MYNILNNILYNVYNLNPNAKKLYESLYMKYNTEDALKKYVFDKFLNLK